MKPIEEAGIILRTTAVREADLFVTILAQEGGKLTALARGARRSKKRFMGGLDLFDCGTFSLTPLKRKDTLYSLESFRPSKHFLGLRTDLKRLSLGSVCLEIASLFANEGDTEGAVLCSPLEHSLSVIDSGKPEDAPRAALSFLLITLQLGGLDPHYAGERFSPEVQTIWERCLANSPEKLDSRTIWKGLNAAFDFAEDVTGVQLRTREHAMHAEPENGASR